MSYARSPRPVCSMTIGMRLACMPSAGPSGPAWIVPGLLFTGNAFCRRSWHDLCVGNHPGEGTIANQLRAQCRTELGAIAGWPTPLTPLALAGHQGLELRRDVGFGHGDPVAGSERVQEQLGAHLPLGPRSDLHAQLVECLLLTRLRQAHVETGEQR